MDITEAFSVEKAGTYQITVNTSGKNLYVGLYLNNELVTYAGKVFASILFSLRTKRKFHERGRQNKTCCRSSATRNAD